MAELDYGKTYLTPQIGEPLSVVAGALADVRFKPGGATLLWDTVPAVSGSPVTLLDGTVIPVGGQYIRYGQVLNMVDSAGVDAFVISGDPDGGGFVIGVSLNGGQFQYTDAIAFDAAAAAVDAAIEAVTGASTVGVVRTGVGPNYTHTVTLAGALLGQSVVFSVIPALTGGTNATVALNETTSALRYGGFGPAQTNATDGRQTLLRGRTYINQLTLVRTDPWGMGTGQSAKYTGLVEAGLLWEARMLVLENTAQAPFTNLPAIANVLAVLPGVRLRTKSAGN